MAQYGQFHLALQDLVAGASWKSLGSVAFVCYWMGVLTYRLYLHPLARFPGPRVAAASFLYEVYWDFVGNGAYLFKTQGMHDKYGRSQIEKKNYSYHSIHWTIVATR